LDDRGVVFFKKLTRRMDSRTSRSPARFAIQPPPPSGGLTFELRKNPREVALVDEAAHQSNVRQPEPVSEQQTPSSFNPFFNQPLMRRYACRLAESTRKIAR
jgi:hypothetical protein